MRALASPRVLGHADAGGARRIAHERVHRLGDARRAVDVDDVGDAERAGLHADLRVIGAARLGLAVVAHLDDDAAAPRARRRRAFVLQEPAAAGGEQDERSEQGRLCHAV